MKYLLSAFILLIAASAFASKPDSGICPWKMPFMINVKGSGNTHSFESSCLPAPHGYYYHDADYGTQPSTTAVHEFEIDTIFDTVGGYYESIQYSLVGDVLQFSKAYQPSIRLGMEPIFQYTTLTIMFAPGKDSITSLTCIEFDSISGNNQSDITIDSFQISNLLFNDTSIFPGDSSFSAHSILWIDDGEDYTSYGSEFGASLFAANYADFTASSVTLSGIFRTTTFSDPPSIVAASTTPNNLAIYASNGSVACSFDIADRERNMEIYSPLGIREASVRVPPNETQASLPHLPAGIYIIRLDGNVRKISIR